MFASDGVINDLAIALHLMDAPISWLGDPFWARTVIILAITWRWTGYNTLIFLAALQSIPGELYEAAEMDGASRWQQFRNVTWPMSIPTTIVVMAYTTIQSFRAFDLIFAMTQGGPNNSSNIFAVLIYQTVFSELRIGYAATQSIFFIIVLVFVTLLQRKFLNSRYEK